MTTLFDVGDEISVRLTGKVMRYTADRNGDAYTVWGPSDELRNRQTVWGNKSQRYKETEQ